MYNVPIWRLCCRPTITTTSLCIVMPTIIGWSIQWSLSRCDAHHRREVVTLPCGSNTEPADPKIDGTADLTHEHNQSIVSWNTKQKHYVKRKDLNKTNERNTLGEQKREEVCKQKNKCEETVQLSGHRRVRSVCCSLWFAQSKWFHFSHFHWLLLCAVFSATEHVSVTATTTGTVVWRATGK